MDSHAPEALLVPSSMAIISLERSDSFRGAVVFGDSEEQPRQLESSPEDQAGLVEKLVEIVKTSSKSEKMVMRVCFHSGGLSHTVLFCVFSCRLQPACVYRCVV